MSFKKYVARWDYNGQTIVALMIIFLFLLINPPTTYHSGFAEEGSGSGISSVLVFQDTEPRDTTAHIGETVTLNGTIRNLVSEDMIISVSIESNGTEGKDWVILDRQPAEGIFSLPAGESVQYIFKVRPLKQGVLAMRPSSTIWKLANLTTPIDANSPYCEGCKSRATLITVLGEDIAMKNETPSTATIALISAAVAISAVGGSVFAWYYFTRKGKKS